MKDFRSFYTTFLIKFIQDTIIAYYVNGTYSLVKLDDSKQKTKTISLINSMNSKMNEIFFSHRSNMSRQQCQSFNFLSSKSIRSNDDNAVVRRADLIREILKYVQLEGQATMSLLSQQLNQELDEDEDEDEEISFWQCSLCFNLLSDSDELRIHIVQTHLYNDRFNKCIVCCYCRFKKNKLNKKQTVY